MFESSPHTPRRIRSRTVIAAALALALIAAACGEDDPIAAPATSPVTTSAALPTTTTSDTPPTTTTASAAEPEPGDAAVDEPSTSATTAPDPPEGAAPSDEGPSGELLWSDVFDDSSASAQACIRESLGEADLDGALARPVTSDDFPTDDDMSILACIGPEHARDVVLSGLVWSMQTETGIMIGAEEMACLRESMADIDVIGMVESSDDSGAIALLGAFGRCLGDAFISLMLVDSGVDFEDLSDGEKACLRERQAGVDWDGLTGDPEASFEVLFELSLGVFECLPELDFDGASPAEAPVGVDDDHANSPERTTSAAVVGIPAGGSLEYDGDVDFFVFDALESERYELYVEPGTLEDPTVALYDADGMWLDYDDDSGGALAPRLYWSADGTGPFYVEVGGFGTGSYNLAIAVSDVEDDHADSSAGATAAAVGEAVRGMLHYGGDIDFFVFDALESERYELYVEPGTLEDPTVTLYDADGMWLDFDDDSGGALAPLVYWEAPSAGSVYVEVGGYGSGSYTLTIAVSDVDDDHADSLEGATAAGVGEAVRGMLHYGGDVDFFVFEAVEGELYELSVEPGTLEDPTVTLYDADGMWLDHDDDSGGSLAPRIYLRAASTGPLYVEVGGYGTGSYTLMITR